MSGKFVTVASFLEPMTANLAKSRLEADGIPCVLLNENTIRMDFFYSQALGGVQLQVPEEFLEQAQDSLRAKPEVVPSPSAEAGEERCPQCGSADVYYERQPYRLTQLLFYLGLPFPFFRKGWKCHKCSHQWRGPKPPVAPLK